MEEALNDRFGLFLAPRPFGGVPVRYEFAPRPHTTRQFGIRYGLGVEPRPGHPAQLNFGFGDYPGQAYAAHCSGKSFGQKIRPAFEGGTVGTGQINPLNMVTE